MANEKTEVFDYDVCLSFAGAQRTYVNEVASGLIANGVRVFYDEYERVSMWGKDLYSHLDEIYQHQARYCILFSSADYADKVWTNHERRSAQARALMAKGEYILPARFDDTPIPGLPNTIYYIDLRTLPPKDLVTLITEKVGSHERREYLPPVPDLLYEDLNISDDDEAKKAAHSQAWSFLKALTRMSSEERFVVLKFLWLGCDGDLPQNVHIDLDLLRRVTRKSPARLKRLLGGIYSLGFKCIARAYESYEDHQHGDLGGSEMLELTWDDLSDDSGFPAIVVAQAMVDGATKGYCEEHGWQFLERLDFAQLASSTITSETH